MAITTKEIKELRDVTGVSVMQCKKALEEAGGDMEKALIILRKKSKEIAGKKSDRSLGAGVVASYIHAGGNVGTMVVLKSETDFVAKNEEFKALAYDIAMHIAASDPEYLSLEDINEEDRNKAREVFSKEVTDKPKELQENILEGKLKSYFKEKVLLEQGFIKRPEVTVSGLIEEAVQKFGERIELSKFVRFTTSG
jgi:elongation factor Ts